jgi:pimeloyl-ACP methyl ester carboxylesterase
MEQIQVDGLHIAYERAGVGPALVLLHGGFGFDSHSWRRQLEALCDEFTVVAWDMPGCGQSAGPPETFRAADFADCLAAFIGALALELYRRYPAIPRSLILASAYAGGAGSLPAEVVQQRTHHVLRALDLPPEQWAREWSPSMLSPSAPTEVVEEVTASLCAFRPVGQRVMVRTVSEQDLRDVLPRISVPTLLLYGDRDVRSPASVGEELHARIPSARLVVLPGVGHVSNLEAPELFNAEVRRFLQSLNP